MLHSTKNGLVILQGSYLDPASTKPENMFSSFHDSKYRFTTNLNILLPEFVIFTNPNWISHNKRLF
jgi:hypothetical protein